MMATAEAPRASDRPALRIDGLCVSRGRPVVHDVSLEIPANAVTALLGPNGAGKSSLVLAVGGVLRPTAGSVLLGEQDLTRRRPEAIRAAGVAIVPEGRRLLGELSVEDNLRVATYALGRSQAQEGIDYALELFPALERRWKASRAHALRRRAADGRARPGPRFPPEDHARRRAVAGPRTADRPAPRTDARIRGGERGRRSS